MAVITDSQITTTSNAKNVQTKTFQIARTDTSTTAVKAVLPAGATLIFAAVGNQGTAASNAGTTGTVTIQGRRVGAAFTTLVASDVKTSAAPTTLGPQGLVTADIGMNPTTLTKDIEIGAYYSETGAASSAGGPWNVTVAYVI